MALKNTGRPPTGQVKWRRNVKSKTRDFCWHARFTINGKRTKFTPLDGRIPQHDEAAARECARLELQHMLSGDVAPKGVAETLSEYATRWLDERERRVHSVAMTVRASAIMSFPSSVRSTSALSDAMTSRAFAMRSIARS
jgi:hypothetical protein